MVLVLPLTDEEAAKLKSKANADGITPEQVVRQPIASILASPKIEASGPIKPMKSLFGIWAQYGPGPSEEEIDENRAQMVSKSKWDDIK